jgi:NCS2 family nucleobase:cation symporter-2
VSKTATFQIEPGQVDPRSIENFVLKQAATWGARPDIAQKAFFGVVQLVEAIADTCWEGDTLLITARFDEFNLDVSVSYKGKPLEFPTRRPSIEQIRDEEEGARLLAGYLLRQNADRIRSEQHGDRHVVHFHYDH